MSCWPWDCRWGTRDRPFVFRLANKQLQRKSRRQVKRLARLSSGLRKEKAASTRLPEQLELVFTRSTVAASLRDAFRHSDSGRFAERNGYKEDVDLELKARELLRAHGAGRIANEVRVR